MTSDRRRTLGSPLGPLTLTGADGVLTGLRMGPPWRDGDQPEPPEQDDTAFGDVAAQLEAYFAGDLTEFAVSLRLEGTMFQRRVWMALLDIPYGETRCYGELAASIGHPGAARAVGLANGSNPIAIIVPCHRVIGSTGKLIGYGGGLDRKRQLLDFESGQLALVTRS